MVNRLVRDSLLAVVALSVLLGARTASADVIFTVGNNPQPNEENILFQTPETGTTITGNTSQTDVPVNFSTLTGQTLYQTAQGQADILSSSSLNSSALTSLKITAPGYGFGDFIMNPLNGTGTATVTVTDNQNNVFQYALGNGQNYLTITTANGEYITEIQITMSQGGYFQQFKQPRISDLCTLGAGGTCTPVPEPASIAILGIGLLGIGAAVRLRPRA